MARTGRRGRAAGLGWAAAGAARCARRLVRLPRSTHAALAASVLVVTAIALVSCQNARPVEPRPVPGLASEPDIRVRLTRGVQTVLVGGPRSVQVRSADGTVGLDLVGPIIVRAAPAGLELADARGDVAVVDHAQVLEFETADPARVLTADREPVFGRLTVRGDPRRRGSSGASFDVIATMPFERYVPGVLVAELYDGWPLGAYMAQAVAARSYALHERTLARERGRHYDIDAATTNQAFTGSIARDAAENAARMTRGQVLTTGDGALVRAYYASTCGGRPASAADTWEHGGAYGYNAAGPLQARPRAHGCEHAPTYRWTRLRPRERLSARLAAYGRARALSVADLDVVGRIDVLERNGAGRPSRYRVVDANGRHFDLSAEQLRLACNHAAGGLPAVTSIERVRSGDAEFVVRGSIVEIHGRGFGHGVGLCQFGAAELTRRGHTYQGVLELFYPGARIERRW